MLVTLTLIAGCATTAKTYKKKGRMGLNINCSGLTSSWQYCEDLAASSCGAKGYKVIAKSGEGQSDEDDPTNFAFGLNPAGFSSRTMIVLCR